MSGCTLCPRNCGVDRMSGKRGYCGMPGEIYAARAALHMWEEPCISGEEGSGTVFFSGCPLRCIYCQNRKIALGDTGKPITLGRLCDIFFELKEKGANNINLVTPTHYADKIASAIEMAKNKDIGIPFVYNTGNYEKVEILKMLDGLIDIYLPDFKYYSPDIAKEYSNAPDYYDYAMDGLREMYRQTGEPEFDERMMMKKGIIVRHLVLPGHTEDSKKVIESVYKEFGDNVYISIMNQYTPLEEMKSDKLLGRKLTQAEYDEVVDYAIDIGVENGFIQEGETAKESFIPSFECEGI